LGRGKLSAGGFSLAVGRLLGRSAEIIPPVEMECV
jgi:hypothetical protein